MGNDSLQRSRMTEKTLHPVCKKSPKGFSVECIALRWSQANQALVQRIISMAHLGDRYHNSDFRSMPESTQARIAIAFARLDAEFLGQSRAAAAR